MVITPVRGGGLESSVRGRMVLQHPQCNTSGQPPQQRATQSDNPDAAQEAGLSLIFFLLFFKFLLALGLHCYVCRLFSSCSKARVTPYCGVQVFLLWRGTGPRARRFHGLSSCSTSCSGAWGLPRSGFKPGVPVLAGFLNPDLQGCPCH